MKLKVLPSLLIVFAIAFANTNFIINPQNPPTGSTGAPGETTCQTSGCHSGGNFKGTVEISGVPDSVQTGVTYTVKLTTKSTGPIRNGFQMTCLTSTKTACGTFSNISGTNVAVASLKQYIRHSNFTSFSGGSASWSFKWKAPAIKNDSSFFYFASLLADGNGNETKDNALSGKKRIYFKTTVGTVEPEENSELVSIKSNLVKDFLYVQLTENKGELWIYNVQGQLLSSQVLSSSDNQIDVSALNKGIHFAIIKTGNREFSKRFMKM